MSTKNKIFEHGSRTTILASQILDEVSRGQFRPGDLLPKEDDLARKLGVCRPTIRQALKALTVAGLVESRPRRGTVLKKGDLRALSSLFAAHLTLSAMSDDEEGEEGKRGKEGGEPSAGPPPEGQVL